MAPALLRVPAVGVTIGTPGIAFGLAAALAMGAADEEESPWSGDSDGAVVGVSFLGRPLFLGIGAVASLSPIGYALAWVCEPFGLSDRMTSTIPSTMSWDIFQVQSLQASAFPCWSGSWS